MKKPIPNRIVREDGHFEVPTPWLDALRNWGRKREEFQMKEGTWLVRGWVDACPKCKLKVETEDAVYCPNCGKWLGVLRGHVEGFLWTAFVGALMAAVFAVTNFAEGAPDLALICLASACGIISVASVLAIKPYGSRCVRLEQKRRRAQEWNDEVAKRQWAEEDRAERERSARAKADSGIEVSIEVHAKEFTRMMKQTEATLRKWNEAKALGVDLEKDDWREMREQIKKTFNVPCSVVGATEDDDNLTGACNCGEGDKSRFHMSWCEKAQEYDKLKLDAAFNIRSVLPVRNGPPLQMAFIDSPDNRESLEEIKRNLEKAYEWRAMLGVILSRWASFRPGCREAGPIETCFEPNGCGMNEREFCKVMFEVRKALDLPVKQEPRCHKVFLSEACGVVITPRSPMGPNSCDKTRKDCMRWKNEERFSL